MATTRRGSFKDLNAFYVFGAFTVLVIHILGFFVQANNDYPGNYDLEALSLILLRFGRSLFIFGTGMLLFYWYKHKPMDWGTFWRKRWHNIIVPYIGWTGIYTFVKLQTFAPDVFFPTFFNSLFTGSSFYHLYYIPLFLQMNLLFMFTKGWLERHLKLPLLLIAFVLQTLVYVLFIHMPETGLLLDVNETSPLYMQALAHGYQSAQNYPYMYVFYFLLGAYAGLNPDRWRQFVKKHWVWACVICVGATLYLAHGFLVKTISYGEALNIFSPLYLVYTSSFILLFYPVSAWIGQTRLCGGWFAQLAKHNLAIYMVHPLILFLLESYVIFRLDWSTFALMLAMFVVTLPLSILVYTHKLPAWLKKRSADQTTEKEQPAYQTFHAG
ncbi:acyltransferase [Brevibacillus fluminis]|uniref:Acyltransferase n=1 Tax=Brevibacillus fluminis TaxID=511487 RepID=A0A3M8DWA5_9BACL|nr:acyltransferase [Brevibacillus fluminis]RNB91785.1 acyltransferase [Brevibacillus fluminis]